MDHEAVLEYVAVFLLNLDHVSGRSKLLALRFWLTVTLGSRSSLVLLLIATLQLLLCLREIGAR